jgi:hypothetical protein
MDDLYAFDKPTVGAEAPAAGAAGAGAPAGGPCRRRASGAGEIVSVSKDDAFVDFGGKSQGIVSLVQFLDRRSRPRSATRWSSTSTVTTSARAC